MLKVRHIKLSNFCQFEKFSLDVREGMTQITGQNGSGKTTVFRALVYGLTGWCDPSWGTQSDLQKDDTPIPGYVELIVTIEEEAYFIKRFAGSGTKLIDTVHKGGQLIVKNRKAVNQWLNQYLPVSTELLAQLMWIRQGKTDWLLSATASQINMFLAQIFDTKFLEEIRKQLKLTCDNIAHLRSDFDTVEKEAKESLTQAESTLPVKEEEMTKLQAEVASYEELLSTLKTGITREHRDAELTRLNNTATQLTTALTELEAEISKLASVEEVDDIELEGVVCGITHNTEVWLQQRERHKELSMELLDLTHRQRRLQEIVVPADCEACGRPMDDECSSAYVNKVVKLTFPEYSTKKDAETLINSRLSEVNQAIEYLQGTIAVLETDIVEAKVSKAEMEKAKAAHSKCLALKLKQQETESHLAKVTELIEALKSQPVIENSVTPEVVTQLIQETNVNISKLSEEINASHQTIGACKAQIESAQSDRQKYKRNEKVRKLFMTARDVLSQSRAQARYISSKISAINNNISHFLDLSEMPFTLYLDATEHVFKYRMHDSDVEHQAGMLSGAQQAAAAMAIQMALVTTALPELNLLLIDEADAALSTENKFIAARMFRSLIHIMSGSSGSLLIISQSEAVTNECDRTHSVES